MSFSGPFAPISRLMRSGGGHKSRKRRCCTPADLNCKRTSTRISVQYWTPSRIWVPAELFSILSNIEQTPSKTDVYHGAVQVVIVIMEHQTLWRFEVNDPLTFTEWRPLWEFDEDQLAMSQELRDELNIINAPVQLRIVRSSH